MNGQYHKVLPLSTGNHEQTGNIRHIPLRSVHELNESRQENNGNSTFKPFSIRHCSTAIATLKRLLARLVTAVPG